METNATTYKYRGSDFRYPLIRFLKTILPLLILIISNTNSHALLGDTNGKFGIDGNIRTMPMMINYSHLPPDLTPNTDYDYPVRSILRLSIEGYPSWDLSYEIHLVQSLDSPPSKSDTTGTGKTQYQALNLSNDWGDNELAGRFWLDRYNIKYSFNSMDLTLGRQAVTFGKAYFWNPLDVFLPFSSYQLDRDYKAGVDAIRLDIALGNFSGINLIGCSGPRIDLLLEDNQKTWESSWYGSAILARMYTLHEEWDISFQLGKIYGGYHIGGGAVGEIGVMETRIEAVYFSPSEDIIIPDTKDFLLEDHFTAVLGTGHIFENNFTFETEYLYNGSGDVDNFEVSFLRYTTVQHCMLENIYLEIWQVINFFQL